MKESSYKKYKLVVDEYLVNGMNGTRAYKEFYPKGGDAAAAVSFKEILAIPKVKAYLRGKQESTSEVLKITHQDVLRQLKNWIELDITQTINLTSEEVKNLPEDVRTLVTSYRHTKTGIEGVKIETIELKFVSKERAMDMVSKHIGFYGEDNHQKNSVTSKEDRERRIALLLEKAKEIL